MPGVDFDSVDGHCSHGSKAGAVHAWQGLKLGYFYATTVAG
ncbi:Protein of unknown function [Pyronema omphalodes CBS 100304]|uniref:Uncharacterized protein n=1 Tax=Pyronema omphalodes (strain CBS 100304) TaxID=1076935 RepID=U4LJ94_PYROM|nr:Protein of unknown function [Pyronema omphalodes CBS 100304]